MDDNMNYISKTGEEMAQTETLLVIVVSWAVEGTEYIKIMDASSVSFSSSPRAVLL